METKLKVLENRESRLLVNYSLDLGSGLRITKLLFAYTTNRNYVFRSSLIPVYGFYLFEDI